MFRGERFPPEELLRQAAVADEVGFDAVCCSYHLAPWWSEGEPAPAHSGNAWVWLGAASQVTTEATIGPAVTALVHRYNPVVVARQAATGGPHLSRRRVGRGDETRYRRGLGGSAR